MKDELYDIKTNNNYSFCIETPSKLLHGGVTFTPNLSGGERVCCV
jgi:hypothetical protein